MYSYGFGPHGYGAHWQPPAYQPAYGYAPTAQAMMPAGYPPPQAAWNPPPAQQPRADHAYKTKLCRFWSGTGTCHFGNRCTFAHGPDELRQHAAHHHPHHSPYPLAAPNQDPLPVPQGIHSQPHHHPPSFTSEYDLIMDKEKMKRVAEVKATQAHVFFCREKATGDECFLKVFFGDDTSAARAERERAMSQLQCPHLLMAKKFFWEENTPTGLPAGGPFPTHFVRRHSAVYRLMDGDLYDLTTRHYMRRDAGIAELRALAPGIMEQLLEALDFLHRNGYVHRDVKRENIYYTVEDGNYRIYLGDYGAVKKPMADGCWAPTFETPVGVPVGTVDYTDEPISSAPATAPATPDFNDPKYDVWCAGLVLYTLMYGMTNIDGEESPLLAVRRGELENGIGQPKSCMVGGYGGKLLRSMFTLSRDARPSAAAALDELRQGLSASGLAGFFAVNASPAHPSPSTRRGIVPGGPRQLCDL